jgi:glycerol-3-phosphate dehydrogenase (NAD(P)+)
MQITILGAGQIGQAVKASLKETNKIFFWDKLPGRVSSQKPLAEIIPESELVFFCIPSSGVVNALEAVRPLLHKKACVISLTKGMDSQSGKFVYEIFQEQLAESQYALLSGPMLAEELAGGLGSAGVVAANDKNILEKLNLAFKPNFIRLEYSADLHSVALAGVLKNIYTVILGVSDGLNYGNNIKGFLVSKILAEAEIVSQILGIDNKIMSGTAGLADFIATAFSRYSLNLEAGIKIAQKAQAPQSEGIVALPSLIKMLPSLGNLPILKALEAIVISRENPSNILENMIYGKT